MDKTVLELRHRPRNKFLQRPRLGKVIFRQFPPKSVHFDDRHDRAAPDPLIHTREFPGQEVVEPVTGMSIGK